MFSNTLPKYKVYASGYRLRFIKVSAGHEFFIVIAVKQITAHRQLFKELRVCSFADISVTIVFLISRRIVVHGLLQSRSNAHIVNH